MHAASLHIGAPDWLGPAAALSAGALALIAWAYRRTAGSVPLRAGCAALKLCALLALASCLLEPMWTSERVKPGANAFAVLADNSLSMQLRGRGDPATRGEMLAALLSESSGPWRAQLAENFEVRNYLADSRLRGTEDFSELDFSGGTSAIGAALRMLGERFSTQPLAGILLLSDGVAPDLEGADFSGLPPVYPVVLGSDAPPRDLAIASTSVSQTPFEDAPVALHAELLAIGCAGETIAARLHLLDPQTGAPTGAAVAEQTLVVPRDSEKISVRFQLKPEKAGVQFYRLSVAPAKAAGDEATLANNESIVTIHRGTGARRILYVSGRPNWEYKFLQRSLMEDPQLEMVGLIRIAKREPKFEFRGRSGESSNPLFRGFGNQSAEEIERYDQPVLVRLNAEDEFELRDGFPKTPEDLFRYRAIILDDLEAEFFTVDQMSLLQRFVSERGGGFLMLGGAESFAEGKYARTPLGDLLPVYAEAPPAEAAGTAWQFEFTREGQLQPWARLRSTEAEEQARAESLPGFFVLNRVRSSKPAATVVATATDGHERWPALVFQPFGRGRSAALLIGDFWQGGFGDDTRQADLSKAWRQIVRWLVADVPDFFELRTEPLADGQSVRLEVRARDPKFQPIENATVALKILPLGAAEPITLTGEASPVEPGLYTAAFVARASGGFRVEAEIAPADSAILGRAVDGWSANLASAEFRSLTPNRALMESIARKTGGVVIPAARLGEFVRELPARRAPITEAWTRPLWHTPAMFAFALACLVAEWGLRRWKGLA
jgi:uncharacterized membrane protein